MIKVSILVPVYGVEKYIEQCATTLFGQTYKNIEYVFVDDCSLDKSINILETVLNKYPQRKNQVIIIHHQCNRGLGAARKTALSASTGDFILNVDSDDYLLPDAVEKLVNEQKKTGADIISGAFQYLFNNKLQTKSSCKGISKQTALKLLLIQNTIPYNIWGRLIRKSIYSENGIDAIEGVNMAEDYGLIPRLVFAAESIVYIDDVIYIYRVSSATSTFSHFEHPHHVISFLKANEAVYQYIHKNDTNGSFSFPMEIGMLNTYYKAITALFNTKQIMNICHYRPQHLLFRLLHMLFAHRHTTGLLHHSYLIIKWCYKKKLHYSI